MHPKDSITGVHHECRKVLRENSNHDDADKKRTNDISFLPGIHPCEAKIDPIASLEKDLETGETPGTGEVKTFASLTLQNPYNRQQ